MMDISPIIWYDVLIDMIDMLDRYDMEKSDNMIDTLYECNKIVDWES